MAGLSPDRQPVGTPRLVDDLQQQPTTSKKVVTFESRRIAGRDQQPEAFLGQSRSTLSNTVPSFDAGGARPRPPALQHLQRLLEKLVSDSRLPTWLHRPSSSKPSAPGDHPGQPHCSLDWPDCSFIDLDLAAIAARESPKTALRISAQNLGNEANEYRARDERHPRQLLASVQPKR